MSYEEFLKSKRTKIIMSGFEIKRQEINPSLFEFQKDILHWSLKKGKSALFADTGLGKGIIEGEWLFQIWKKEQKPVLLIAPLAVSYQLQREIKNILGYESQIIEKTDDVINGINIINYEKIEKLDCSLFVAVALDESSRLKSYSSKTREIMIKNFDITPYKLAATATPAPNDYMELGNHAEFLNVMSRNEMLSMYFIHDSGDTAKWRLKGHANIKFWEWIASWAIVIRHPRELGYNDNRYDLPELNIKEIMVKSNYSKDGELFGGIAKTMTERRKARRTSFEARCLKAAEIANSIDDVVLVWCELNDESKMLKQNIIDGVEVKGSDKDEHKKKSLLGFANNEVKALISKPKIAGFGMNWQNCHNIIFTGLSDSFEQYYQAMRRCWRFGQEKTVNVYIISSEQEGSVMKNIKRKEKDYKTMMESMSKLTIDIVKHNLFDGEIVDTSYNPQIDMKLPKWL